MPHYPEKSKEILNTISVKYLTVMEKLIEDEVVKNERQFLMTVGIRFGQINDIKSGKRFCTIEMIWMLIMKYNVNANYLFPPFSKQMFLKDNKKSQVQKLRMEIEQKKKEIKLIEMYGDD